MQSTDSKKDSFRRFLIFFCSWNFLLDLAGLAFLIWFASFIKDTERVMGHYLLILVLSLISVVRGIICSGFLIVKMIQKKWKQFLLLFAGFFVQLFITICFCGLLFLYVFAMGTTAIGPAH
ncbi:MAG TPA: hypothetical protein VFJ43_16210 [Bacteroidia bacterium]|nr:hypothetical protein [Bacteroidia bacterium]